MTIFIGGAWPYANGSLHLGHAASLLPGDILARYYRLKGEKVLYVSGSDCHGTPISIRADKEGVEPGDIADRYTGSSLKRMIMLLCPERGIRAHRLLRSAGVSLPHGENPPADDEAEAAEETEHHGREAQKPNADETRQRQQPDA